MRRQKAVPVGEIFLEMLRRNGLEEGVRRVDIFNAWNSVVGERYSRYTTSKFFRDGRLVCTISSSAAKSSLIMHRLKIVQKMNTILGEQIVKELIVK
jgi:hypothetical protein